MPQLQDEETPENPEGPELKADTGAFAFDAGVSVYAKGFAEVLWCALFHPRRVFGRPFSGYFDLRALVFAMGITALIPAVQQAYVYLLAPLLVDVLSISSLVALFPARMSTPELVRAILIVPVLLPIPLALYALVLHLLLKLAQGAERGFAVTLQCVCFASSCGIFRIVPHFGDYLAVILWLEVLAVGLRQSHGSAWYKVLPVMALHCSAVAWLVALAAGWVILPL